MRVRRTPPTWTRPTEAALLILRGYTARTGIVVAAIVGTVLSAVNDGVALARGLTPALAGRVATNYVVPFLVSSVGYLAPLRRPADGRGEDVPVVVAAARDPRPHP